MKQTTHSPEQQRLWFSAFFGLDKPQYELPFVDFDLNADVPVYIDPYAITKDPTEFAATCHNTIFSYFQTLLEAVIQANPVAVRRLIRGRLSEPEAIHFGVGKSARRGRGIGSEQENSIVKSLTNSAAAKSGVIQAIQELELHVEGIGPDKISDLVANIILSQLAQFTEEVCGYYGIATRPCAVSGFWNSDQTEWGGGYFNLPVYHHHSYILVPRRFVRRERDLMNHREFYDKYVLEILQRELLDASDSLMHTLKNGERRITKKSLKEDTRFKLSKGLISSFILDHPEAIDGYRKDLRVAFKPADPALWSGKAREDDPEIENILRDLDHIEPGREQASLYHRTVFSLLEFVFDWALENFEKEYGMAEGRGRIDIIADNYAGAGLFADFRTEYQASSLPIECKNYKAELGNNEYNQLNDRLGDKTSRLGMIFCRTIQDRSDMMHHCTDRWLRQHNMILVFDDESLKQLVVMRLIRDFQGIEALLRQMIRHVKYGHAN